MKNDKTIEINVSEKHLPARIVGFVLAFLVAVGAFAFGVTRIGYKEEGYYNLTAAADQELPLYGTGINATFLFKGKSSEIKLAIGAADKIYSVELKDCYKLLDAKNEYAGVVNIATINAHLNEDVKVSPELFAVLTDAYARTREQKGYSLFAGPLLAEWQSILVLTEPEDFDPLRNPEEAKRLEELALRTGDISQFNLVVVNEEEHILRMEVPESYLAFLEAYELEPTVVDLNLLRDAYLLELLAPRLEEQGLTQGYLSSDSGLILALSGQDSGEYCLYGRRESEPVRAAVAPVRPHTACSLFLAFSLTGGEDEFYVLEEQGRTHLRNPYIPASGVDAEVLLSACVIRSDSRLVEACYENICLHALESPAAVAAFARESGAEIAYLLQDGTQSQVWVNPAGEKSFAAAAEYGFETKPVP